MNRKPTRILEELLVIGVQSGDPKSVEGLIGHWNQRFLRFAYQITADHEIAKDVVQESWVSIMKGVSTIRDSAKFGSWAFRIVHNKSYDVTRSVIRQRKLHENFAVTKVSVDQRNFDPAEGESDSVSDEVKAIRHAISTLEHSNRLILTLFYEEEMSLDEIRTVTGDSISALKSRLYHVRKKLKSILERNNDGQ